MKQETISTINEIKSEKQKTNKKNQNQFKKQIKKSKANLKEETNKK